MSESRQKAEQLLLHPGNLKNQDINDALSEMMRFQADAADLYFQYTTAESFMLEDGIVKEGSYHVEQGVGARVMSGEKTGFAYSDELSKTALTQAVNAARSIGKQGQNIILPKAINQADRGLYTGQNPIQSMDTAEKVQWLRKLDHWIRARDNRVTQVIISMAASHTSVLLYNTEGNQMSDLRPMVRLNVQVVMESDGKREAGRSGGGGRYNLQMLMSGKLPYEFCQQAIDQAATNLVAKAAPAGPMTVVLGPGWPGVLLHEAIGHGLEGDFNRKGVSAFSQRMGDQVANSACTIVDDGTLENRRGSLNYDDEGVATQQTVLIEEGVLKNYMIDRMNARLMGTQSTGNGRRESYAHPTLPRMTNTYMLPGQYEAEEIIASVPDGLYAANFGGGQVDITSGKFVFSASEAWRIRDGKICEPVRGATLIGDGPSVLNRVEMVGNDLQLDAGVGVCGKEGQSVPVGVGQPTLKIKDLIVGGTGA